MPKFLIEREIHGAGDMSQQQLQAVSEKSCAVLRNRLKSAVGSNRVAASSDGSAGRSTGSGRALPQPAVARRRIIL